MIVIHWIKFQLVKGCTNCFSKCNLTGFLPYCFYQLALSSLHIHFIIVFFNAYKLENILFHIFSVEYYLTSSEITFISGDYSMLLVIKSNSVTLLCRHH